MAYTAVPTVTTGELWTAANHNTYIRDNFAAGVPDIFTTKGDIAVATAADVATRLGVGTNNYVIKADSGEASGIKWASQNITETIFIQAQGGWNTTDGNELAVGSLGRGFVMPDAKDCYCFGYWFRDTDATTGNITIQSVFVKNNTASTGNLRIYNKDVYSGVAGFANWSSPTDSDADETVAVNSGSNDLVYDSEYTPVGIANADVVMINSGREGSNVLDTHGQDINFCGWKLTTTRNRD